MIDEREVESPKPCPFCGGPGSRNRTGPTIDTDVYCVGCAIEVPRSVWYRRTPPPATRKVLEEVARRVWVTWPGDEEADLIDEALREWGLQS